MIGARCYLVIPSPWVATTSPREHSQAPMKSWSAKFDDSLMDIGHHFGAVQNILHWLIIYFKPYFTTTCRCHRLGHGSIAVFQIGNRGWSSLPSEDSECCRLFPSFGFIITLRSLFHPKLTPSFEIAADFFDEQYMSAILMLWHQTLNKIKFEQSHFLGTCLQTYWPVAKDNLWSSNGKTYLSTNTHLPLRSCRQWCLHLMLACLSFFILLLTIGSSKTHCRWISVLTSILKSLKRAI